MAPRLPRAMAVGSEDVAVQAATTLLAHGNAVDALVAGIFAAAGASAGVLLGPVQMLVAGAGAGLRAIDGRTRQPGSGAARPRGFRAEDAIPPAASVAVPALPAALASALATFGTASLARVLGPAIDLAKSPAPARAAVLKRIAQRGATLSQAGIANELVSAAGRVTGGLLTLEDLEEVRPGMIEVSAKVLGTRKVATVPWGAAAVRDTEAEPMGAERTQVLAVIDGRGLIAVACYEAPEDGLPIPELELVAPFGASPVRRGETRVRPGELRASPAPIALVEGERAFDLAVGIAGLPKAERALGAWLVEFDPLESTLPDQGRAVAVLRTPTGVRPLGRRL